MVEVVGGSVSVVVTVTVVDPPRPDSTAIAWITGAMTSPWSRLAKSGLRSMVRSVEPLG